MAELKGLDGSELFSLLESNQSSVAENIRTLIHESFSCTKESWLLNGLFDYYLSTNSARCVEILLGIREPHDKFLFDRLAECLKGSSKLQGLTLLGHVIRKQPSWLYKISNHSLLKELLKVLKMETDIVLLTSALMVIITLLPMIPAIIAPFLQDIFEIFSRLASWEFHHLKETSQIFQLHLQIGMYALFLRLYGMYPCNFLSYLRQLYGHAGRENLQIFSHTVKPMIETVKMHPLLVTATKEVELATTRWKRMETHDIVVECAKFSVDAQKKSEEDKNIHCHPSAKPKSSSELTSEPETAGHNFSGPPQQGSQLFQFIDPSGEVEMWTPTYSCGLFTPPAPHQEMDGTKSSSTSVPQTPTPQGVGTPLTREHLSPPEAAVEATPETTPFTTPIKELDTTRSSKQLPSAAASRPLAFGHKSTSRNLSSGTSTPSQSHPSSPLKKETSPFHFPETNIERKDSLFSSERRDSLFSQRLQKIVMDRMQFQEPCSTDQPPPCTDNSSERHKKVTRHLSPNKTSDSSHGLTSPVKVSNCTQPPLETETKPVEKWAKTTLQYVSNDYKKSDYKEGPDSQQQAVGGEGVLYGFQHWCTESDQEEDGCDSMQPEYSDSCNSPSEDEEVCDLDHEFSCDWYDTDMLCNKSMLDFAKRVHRLRFYSQCGPAPNLQDVFNSAGTSPSDNNIYLKVRRANSCPEIKRWRSMEGEDVMDGNVKNCSKKVKNELHVKVTVNGNVTESISTSGAAAGNVCLHCGHKVPSVNKTSSHHSSETQTIDSLTPLPYEHLFPGVLPPVITQPEDTKVSPFSASTADSVSHKNQLTPHQLLDQLIESASAIHMEEVLEGKKGFTRMKSPGSELDELKILQAEVLMLRDQLLFERHRREIHAERNRRLLGKAKSARALEEHNYALKDQLHLLEKEMKGLLYQVQSLESEKRKQNIDSLARNDEIHKLEQKNKQLQELNKSQEKEVQKQTQMANSLRKELQNVQASLFNTSSELKILRGQVALKDHLQLELNKKNMELMLMGELQQKYREKFSQIPVTRQREQENTMLRESCREQVAGLQEKLESHVSQLEAARARISELENLLTKKDMIMAEQKRLLKTVEDGYQEQLQAVERKYQTNKSINQQLEEQILELHHKLELATKCQHRERKGQSPSSDSLNSEVDGVSGSSPDKSGPYGNIGSSPEKITVVGSPHSSLSESLGSEKGEAIKKMYRDVPMRNLEVIVDREMRGSGAEEEEKS